MFTANSYMLRRSNMYFRDSFKHFRKVCFVALLILTVSISICAKSFAGQFPIQTTEDFEFYKMLADHGDFDASVTLAQAYMQGKVVPQNYNEAVRLLSVASDNGVNRAAYILASMYQHGLNGVEQNCKAAISVLSRSESQHQNGYTEYMIGNIYDTSAKCKNKQVALDWYIKAKDKGENMAKARVAEMLFYGDGVKVDKHEATRLAKELVDADESASAYGIMANAHIEGVAALQNFKLAYSYASKGAALGDVTSQSIKSRMLRTGAGCKKDRVEAYAWAVVAAEYSDKSDIELMSQGLSLSEITQAQARAKIIKDEVQKKVVAWITKKYKM